jgi:transposase
MVGAYLGRCSALRRKDCFAKEFAIFWYGGQTATDTCRPGPLALVEPLLRDMRVAEIINQHVPADPQAEFDHGEVLSLLIAARLANPIALVNVQNWAAESGAELLWNIPAAKLNDDRLARALDALFTERHSILASISLHVAQSLNIPLNELHFDPTSILFYGAYEDSQPRDSLAGELPSNAALPPAHITKGWSSPDASHKGLLVHAGLCQFVDELGPVPLFAHLIDGNQNGHTAIAQQYALLCQHLRPPKLTMISDRGTCSAPHLARLFRAGHHALCAAPWDEYRACFQQYREQLSWNRASYLSIEQQRRRREGNLPQEHYDLAEVPHAWTDPETKQAIPGRLIFVFSSADQKVARAQREKQLHKIQSGLTDLARNVAEGRRLTNAEGVSKRVQKLLGKSAAAKYFHWELVPLTKAERNRWSSPGRGCTTPEHRFVFRLDQAAVDRDAQDDGYAVLVATVPAAEGSTDELFRKYKQQIHCEHSHHIFKGPLAVHPVFLKKPERVEALLFLLTIALQAYFVLQRRYRTALPADASVKQRRMTARTLLKTFDNYILLIEETARGRCVQATRLTPRQREIIQLLHLPTLAQTLSRRLPRAP